MSLFGSKPSAFGQNTGSVFGQPTINTNNTTAGSSLFGQTMNAQNPQNQNAFGQSMNQQQQQQQPAAASFMNASQAGPPKGLIWEEGRDAPHTQKPITEQCVELFQKWNPQSPRTTFKHYFYNKVADNAVPFYRPGPNEDPQEWEEANRNKPGPGFMPALGTGFAAIAERLKNQRAILAQFNHTLHLINTNLDALMSDHELRISTRALEARRRHVVLRQRCLALATKVQVLRNRGYQMDADEDALKLKLEDLEHKISDPALSARTEELWSKLILLRGHADTLRNEINSKGGEYSDAIPEEAEAKAKKLLEDYNKQLQALKVAVDKIKEDYEEWQKEHNPAAPAKK